MREQAIKMMIRNGTVIKLIKDERTMLPGLSTTINSLSTSWSRTLTGVEVTGGSCLCTTFLEVIT